jgi:predicted DNA-binding WGR domain protein
VNRSGPIDSKLSLDRAGHLRDRPGMENHRDAYFARRIDAARNMARYYALTLQPTLFGDTALVRNWGRIGTKGQQKVELYPNAAEARSAFRTLCRRKAAKGYQPTSDDPAGRDGEPQSFSPCPGVPSVPGLNATKNCQAQ